jgi:hypothetical protein
MSQSPGAAPATRRAADWRDLAVCRDEEPDLFFPAGSTGPYAQQIEDAKAVCRRCPSVEPCLRWALDTGQETGIWGATSEAERRTLQRRRRNGALISTDDYTGTPRVLTRGRTLQEAWDENTKADGDHVRWTGTKTVHRPGDRALTPNRLAFYLDRGHWPEGDVKRMCPVEGCVRPAHLADRRERAEVVDLAAAA